ncbi:hypothetical protein GALL_156670 [mine drainage metagenome]|uniref:Uncharacterized protein n=1 Tax=mine drainage metagenome TaxID=410659 RepID=A0A1J5S238_9ZZZZ
MIETLTLITLGVLFLVFFRPGKTPPLESQLVIERPGQYKITLAPKLNLAQPFIEAIIDRLAKSNVSTQHGSARQFFAVSDRQVATAHGDVYLLAIIVRGGMIHFVGSQPVSGGPANYLETIKTNAKDLLEDFPVSDERSKALEDSLFGAIREASGERGIVVEQLKDQADI